MTLKLGVWGCGVSLARGSQTEAVGLGLIQFRLKLVPAWQRAVSLFRGLWVMTRSNGKELRSIDFLSMLTVFMSRRGKSVASVPLLVPRVRAKQQVVHF